MKLIICLLLIAACIYLGISLSTAINKKKRFWEDLVKLCEVLTASISFGQKKLREILLEYKQICGNSCSQLIDNFLFNENNKFPFEVNIKGIIFSIEEENLLKEFFDKIGELDAYNEIIKINNYKLRFDDYLKQQSEKSIKLSPLLIKLSIIFGIIVCIVFI